MNFTRDYFKQVALQSQSQGEGSARKRENLPTVDSGGALPVVGNGSILVSMMRHNTTTEEDNCDKIEKEKCWRPRRRVQTH